MNRWRDAREFLLTALISKEYDMRVGYINGESMLEGPPLFGTNHLMLWQIRHLTQIDLYG